MTILHTRIFPGMQWHYIVLACLLSGTGVTFPPAAQAAEEGSDAGGFRFAEVSDKSLGLWEGAHPVFVYNYGMISKPGVPADRTRSTYLHPIYGLDGEVITDDFPKDHYHHRGLFWAWPHIKMGDKEYSTWDLRGMEQRFVKWTAREASPQLAVLGAENGWFIGDKQAVREQVELRVHPATQQGRAIDVDLVWMPLGQPITLVGAPAKSYGGLTLRFAPRTDTVITTPLGQGDKDLAVTRLKWADLSARFAGAEHVSGAAIFIAPQHPDYPPTWLTRHYGVLCVGWPGVEPLTLPPDKPVRCQYRVWIHRGPVDQATLQRQYDQFTASVR